MGGVQSWLPLLFDRTYKSKPSTRDGPDKALRSAVVPDGVTNRRKPAAERGIRVSATVPYVGNYVFLGDDSVMVANEVFENVKYLRCHGYKAGASPQFPAISIEGIILKLVRQFAAPARPRQEQRGRRQQI